MKLSGGLSRRALLSGALFAPALARADAEPDLVAAADAAYTFAAPLLEMAKVRARAFAAGQRPGVFAGRRELATPAQRTVTMPNNDTVYASAFVDLRQGPAVFTVPPSPGRYASLQVMDFYSNNIAVASPRTGAEAGRTLRIVAPGSPAEAGDIVSPTPWIWALARVLVDGPEDLAAALSVRGRFTLRAPISVAPPAAPPASETALDILAAAQALMQENPPLGQDAAALRAMAPLGLGPGRTFDAARFDAAARTRIAAGVAAAQARARDPRASGRLRAGWLYNAPATGVFGRDYALRAAVATFGLAALPPQEATYLRAAAPDGGFHFEGPGPWVLRFPPGGLPPVGAFWSATLYAPTPGGQYFLVDNPAGRYAIGDRTPGLRRDDDGALEIWIARAEPGPARRANWLPAPAAGPFAVVLRAYLPKPALLDGAYSAPPIVAVPSA